MTFPNFITDESGKVHPIDFWWPENPQSETKRIMCWKSITDRSWHFMLEEERLYITLKQARAIRSALNELEHRAQALGVNI